MEVDEISTSAPTMKATNALSKLAESASESESRNVSIRGAGGGLLSRLQPQSEESSDSDEDIDDTAFQRTMKRYTTSKAACVFSSDEEEDDNGEDAYERIKKQMKASAPEKQAEPEAVIPTQPVTAMSSSEVEDEAPVRATAARRLKPRRERTASPLTSPAPSVRSRRSSPGLFVTPNASPVNKQTFNAASVGADSEGSSRPTYNADFNERVKRIRAERLAKKRQENEAKTKATRREVEEDGESNSDDESGRRLTQQARPTRKAGKKAIEAMVRDQQRIVRSMQLTHQSKTKKKYGTRDLFAKFGFSTGVENSGLPTPDTSSQPASPDAELYQTHATPTTNERAPMNDVVKTAMATPTAMASLIDNASLPSPKLDKGKGRAPEFQHLPPNLTEQSKPTIVQHAQIIPKEPAKDTMVELSGSEDDLDFVQPRSRFPVFDRVPERKAQESTSLLHLRHLAQLSNDSGIQGRKSMNNVELQISLHRKAREQAQKARDEKLAELRAKGIHIETEEEREKRQAEVEDMVARFEKAREHDLAIAKREREQAKKNGEIGDGLVSSDEDEDYIASGEEDVAEAADMDGDDEEEDELELSGSEEEVEDGPDEEDEIADKPHGLFDETADEDDEEEAEGSANDPKQDLDMDDDDDLTVPVRSHGVKRAKNVVVDDEDEDEVVRDEPLTQDDTQNDAMAVFGFGNAAPPLGLTQAFAGTMASLASDSQDSLPEPEQDSMEFLRSLPDTQPNGASSQINMLVPNSQSLDVSQDGPVSQIDLEISQMFQAPPEFTATQLSEVPEPTQDAGFLLSRSPAGFPHMRSSIGTVMVPVAESPIKERKGKLRQRQRETPVKLSDVDDDNASAASETEADEAAPKNKSKDIFSVMKKAAKKQQRIDDFNKQTSWAKDIVEDQAHESEDEYAGLGGASDDDSGNEMDDELAEMIDTTDVKVDESELAAYFNEQETKTDAARAAKLHQDIISGALRKRTARGNAFDISDSEDEHEMRRRKAQRERQRMGKAILQDERIGKLAQNAKQAAFINTMIDTSDDAEYGFLDEPEQPVEASQSQSPPGGLVEGGADEEIAVPDSQTIETVNPLKRKAPGLDPQEKENRAPANQRRTAAPAFNNPYKKARTLPEIQHQLCELLEDPGVVVPDSQYISGSDDEDTAPAPPVTKAIIVDRLSLSRTSTSSSDNVTFSRNMAFGTSAQAGGFRVPSLVRRATSNLSTVSERSASNSAANAPTEGVRRGGTGKSNIHAQAREAERRVVLEKAEAKRKESLKKKVGRARGVRSVLRTLGGGFE